MLNSHLQFHVLLPLFGVIVTMQKCLHSAAGNLFDGRTKNVREPSCMENERSYKNEVTTP